MTSAQFVRRAFALFGKVVFSVIILGVIGAQIYLYAEWDPDSFWLELLMAISVSWKFFLFMDIWGKAEEPFADENQRVHSARARQPSPARMPLPSQSFKGTPAMIDPRAFDIICETFDSLSGNEETTTVANAMIGALAMGGFAIVQVDPDVMRRVLAEMSKES